MFSFATQWFLNHMNQDNGYGVAGSLIITDGQANQGTNISSINLDKNKPIKSLGNSLPDIYLEFKKAMNDDLNTPRALGIFFDWMKTESIKIKDNLASDEEISSAWNFLKVFNSIFDFIELSQLEVPENIAAMLENRREARRNKDWVLSDQIRKSILGEGWLVEDTPDGQNLKKA